MYTREEILNNYKNVDFPESFFDELVLNNKRALFYDKSKQPSTSQTKDTSKISQSYVLPWRIVQQKNYHMNNNQNKLEFVRGANFTPPTPKEPLIEIKVDNFQKIYDKYSIPLDKKIIYLKSKNNILGPFNFEELQNMYKNKKFDSNYEFRTIDLFTFNDEDPFCFYSVKNINEDNWTDELVDSPNLEYTELFTKVKELLDATKKRKIEINELNDEIDDLKGQNEEKDNKINDLTKEIESLNKELLKQKKLLKQKEKEEDEKEEKKDEEKEEKKEKKEKIEIIEVEKKVIYNNNEDDDEDENEEVIEEEKIEIIKPKVLDMGGEWEVAGKKKKKVEKIQEDPKKIVGLPSKKEGAKNNTDSLTKTSGSNKPKKNKNSGEELLDTLKPKKKEIIKDEGELSTTEFKEVKGKGKKKNKKQFESTNISLGFKY